MRRKLQSAALAAAALCMQNIDHACTTHAVASARADALKKLVLEDMGAGILGSYPGMSYWKHLAVEAFFL